MSEPRQKTANEIRNEFLAHVVEMVDYWKAAPDYTPDERMANLAYAIVGTLDGEFDELPAFIVAPMSHPRDRELSIEMGDDYFPVNTGGQVTGGISGDLNELLHARLAL
jgi:hypothetical protein